MTASDHEYTRVTTSKISQNMLLTHLTNIMICINEWLTLLISEIRSSPCLHYVTMSSELRKFVDDFLKFLCSDTPYEKYTE